MADAKAVVPLNIFQALPKIIGDIAPISKDRKNVQQGYSFRGIDDVYAALNLLLAKYGVSILPELVETKHEAAGTAKSGATFWRHMIRIRYHLIASDGSKLSADSEGEGMDTGDKSVPKAFSTAFKAMAFQVFCIPTGEKVDTEEESPEVHPPAAPKTNGHSKPPPASQQVMVVPASVLTSAAPPPEEQLFIRLTEQLPDHFTSQEEKDKWQATNRTFVNGLPAHLKKAFVEDFSKVAVKS